VPKASLRKQLPVGDHGFRSVLPATNNFFVISISYLSLPLIAQKNRYVDIPKKINGDFAGTGCGVG
jgi:hypothetical protein